MINKEVIPAFEMLLEELERIIPDLNAQSKDLLDQKQYTQAHDLINKAQSVIAFQAKVAALRDEWARMQVPATKPPQVIRDPKPPKAKRTSRRTDLGRIESGLRTKNSDLHMPILRALVNRGGSMQFADLLVILRHYLKEKLNQYDLALLPDGKTIRWENNVGWAKKQLIDAGYLSSTAPKGTWEITALGREALEEYEKKKIAEPHQLYLTEDVPLRSEPKPFFTIGQSYHRQTDLHDQFGGNRQSGISVCSRHPIIFLFSSPSGKESGYKDGLYSSNTYIYSGEGAIGDMEFTRGNKAILNHQADGKELHLFKKERSGLYEYLGQFEYAYHKIIESEDIKDEKRKLIQFTLTRV